MPTRDHRDQFCCALDYYPFAKRRQKMQSKSRGVGILVLQIVGILSIGLLLGSVFDWMTFFLAIAVIILGFAFPKMMVTMGSFEARVIENTLSNPPQLLGQLPGINYQWLWEAPVGPNAGIIDLRPTAITLLDDFRIKNGEHLIVNTKLTIEVSQKAAALVKITKFGGLESVIQQELRPDILATISRVLASCETESTAGRTVSDGVAAVTEQVETTFGCRITSIDVVSVHNSDLQKDITAGKRRANALGEGVASVLDAVPNLDPDVAVREIQNAISNHRSQIQIVDTTKHQRDNR
jgi:predicted small secreted protein